MANKEQQHPHPQPHPQRTSSSRRRRLLALPQAPVSSARRIHKRARRCSARKSHRRAEVHRLDQDCLADRTSPAARASQARLCSAETQPRRLLRLLPDSWVVQLQASLWEALRLLPDYLAGTKTLRPVQTKARPLRFQHPQVSLEAERQLVHKARELPNHRCLHLKPPPQHQRTNLPPSASVQPQQFQHLHSLHRVWVASPWAEKQTHKRHLLLLLQACLPA